MKKIMVWAMVALSYGYLGAVGGNARVIFADKNLSEPVDIKIMGQVQEEQTLSPGGTIEFMLPMGPYKISVSRNNKELLESPYSLSTEEVGAGQGTSGLKYTLSVEEKIDRGRFTTTKKAALNNLRVEVDEQAMQEPRGKTRPRSGAIYSEEDPFTLSSEEEVSDIEDVPEMPMHRGTL